MQTIVSYEEKFRDRYKQARARMELAGERHAQQERLRLDVERRQRIAAEEAEREARRAAEAEALDKSDFARIRKLFSTTSKSKALRIISEVAEAHGITPTDLIGPSRTTRCVVPRQAAMCRVRVEVPTLSLPQIGRLFGGRDHTTVLHALRKGGVNG